ncbi:hypothetical protein OTK59_21645 [Vibrio natriegens]|uniref:hypothetical protein n=1 Tax=Vibrio TaxID=662 RepID=UPI000243C03A|nr:MULTISPECIES: hypothetical protein [Vibrio]AEX24598.1 hypothetical protein VEJY3_20916 [Vibrio sp. EJY3]MCY9879164.1 hypothetical protein [Vibrio natriegens]
MNFNVIKKNRKYFAATTDNNKSCKILIDECSKDLELGEHFLAVKDISVRSKYGTDLIYKLTANVEEQTKLGICSLKSEYNTLLIEKCRKLGGTWDKSQGAWIFSSIVEKEVEELDEIFNSAPVIVEIEAIEEIQEQGKAIEFLGYPVCKAFSRDSGARIETGIALLSGYATSGGSKNRWTTVLSEGATLRLKIPEDLLNIYEDKKFQVKTI